MRDVGVESLSFTLIVSLDVIIIIQLVPEMQFFRQLNLRQEIESKTGYPGKCQMVINAW